VGEQIYTALDYLLFLLESPSLSYLKPM